MISRIHLALGFTPPGAEMRRKIWRQCLSTVPDGETAMEDVDGAVNKLQEERLNGREISNAVSTARTIARFSNEALELVHIRKVLKIRQNFHIDILGERRKATIQAAAVAGAINLHGGVLTQNSSILTGEPEEYTS